MNELAINRAPVMTLWAVVVAERLGHPRALALTLGRAVAGLNAASKSNAIGRTRERDADDVQPAKPAKAAKTVALLGRAVPVVKTREGLRAVASGEPLAPAAVEKYLSSKFGAALRPVREAMEALARSRAPAALAHEAYALYEAFRPEIPAGEAGWGAKGSLSLAAIKKLAGPRR